MRRIEEVYIDGKSLLDIIDNHNSWMANKGEGERAMFIDCDLREIDFSGMYLNGIDFGMANLSGSDFGLADIRRCSFGHAILNNCNMAFANIEHCDFSSAKMRNVPFRYTFLFEVNFFDCDLRGCDFVGCNLPPIEGLIEAHLDEKFISELMYLVVSQAKYSMNISDEVKGLLTSQDIIDLANRSEHKFSYGVLRKPFKSVLKGDFVSQPNTD